MTTPSIAREIAGKWGLAGSTNLVLWGLLAVLIALGLGIGGGWWVAGGLKERKYLKADNKQLSRDLEATGELVDRQQTVIVDSSRQLEQAALRMSAISKEAADARAENQRQMALIRNQLEVALATRPDLADVRVGSGVLEAWNSANRGRAAGGTGVAQSAPGVRPQPDATRTGKPARGPER